MTKLGPQGQRLLALLVDLLPSVDPERPDKLIGYKEAHLRLGLDPVRSDWGESLKAQGLEELAEWTKVSGFPAITGLIVNQNDYSPGKGYFSLFDRPNLDWQWWRDQIIECKKFNWKPFLVLELNRSIPTVSFSDLIKRVLQEYSSARGESFARHPLANLIRTELPKSLSEWIKDRDRYQCEGSPGRGVWAEVPWVSVVDRLITETVQEGYYLVYLFDGELSGLYLSLNQGVTSVKAQYGSAAADALRARARDMHARLGDLVRGLEAGPIDLSIGSSSSIACLYEVGSVCSIFYPVDEIPSDDQMRSDFHRFMLIYEDLAARDDRLFSSADIEDDELELGVEDARKLREHKRIERNRALAKKAKKVHGYICKACGFDFEERYGAIGKEFIEAHHLVPLSKLKGAYVSLNARRDFTVLCANCHRMIHKTDTVGSVREFRSRYVAGPDAD